MTENNQAEQQRKRIHPALDFTDEHAYIGQIMRQQRTSMYHIITDQGFVISVQSEAMENNRLELTHKPYPYAEIRWTTESKA